MRCERCGTKIRGGAFGSPLGERLCAACHDRVVGLVVGSEQGGLGESIALAGNDSSRPAGVLAWIRRALRRDG